MNHSGRAQDFERGRLTYTQATEKVTWQRGKVLKRYDRLGRERSALGMPVSDLWGSGGYRGGTYANGRIIWSKGEGAHVIRGMFDRAFRRTGGVKGKLGLPRSDRERAETLPGGGRRQRFVSGRLPATRRSEGVRPLG